MVIFLKPPINKEGGREDVSYHSLLTHTPPSQHREEVRKEREEERENGEEEKNGEEERLEF